MQGINLAIKFNAFNGMNLFYSKDKSEIFVKSKNAISLNTIV
jgi:hypothetical protein